MVLAVASGGLWASVDSATSWQARDNGLPSGRIDTVAVDPHRSDRLWTAGADQVFRSDDRGASWRPAGSPLGERNTRIRGIGVTADDAAIVLTTDRGLFRTADGGATWELLVDNLPAHLEARPLVVDPHQPGTFYAGFSLTPYEALWQRAADGQSVLSRLDTLNLASGLAFIVLLAVAAGAALRRLARYYRSDPEAARHGAVVMMTDDDHATALGQKIPLEERIS